MCIELFVLLSYYPFNICGDCDTILFVVVVVSDIGKLNFLFSVLR